MLPNFCEDEANKKEERKGYRPVISKHWDDKAEHWGPKVTLIWTQDSCRGDAGDDATQSNRIKKKDISLGCASLGDEQMDTAQGCPIQNHFMAGPSQVWGTVKKSPLQLNSLNKITLVFE